MDPLPTLLELIATILIAAFGMVSVFRPQFIVNFGRYSHEHNKLNRILPFGDIVLKPWYPKYVRFMGFVGLGCCHSAGSRPAQTRNKSIGARQFPFLRSDV